MEGLSPKIQVMILLFAKEDHELHYSLMTATKTASNLDLLN